MLHPTRKTLLYKIKYGITTRSGYEEVIQPGETSFGLGLSNIDHASRQLKMLFNRLYDRYRGDDLGLSREKQYDIWLDRMPTQIGYKVYIQLFYIDEMEG